MVWVCNYHVDFPNDSSDVTCLLCRRPGASGAEGVDDSFAWWAVSTGNQISSRLLSARLGGGMHIVVQGGEGHGAGAASCSALLVDPQASEAPSIHPVPRPHPAGLRMRCWRCLRPAAPWLRGPWHRRC